MQNLMKGWQRGLRPSILLIALLLVLFSLAACGRSLFGDKPAPAEVSANVSNQSTDSQNASLALQPASGYGGLYVQVQGTNWPQNMMVLVTLEDAQGRSETLAASDTDQEGNLTTGFLFPIDERWLAAGSLWVVTTTADGRIAAKAKFTIVPPGVEVAISSPLTTTASAAATSDVTTTNGTSTNGTSTVAMIDEELDHTLALPLVTSAGLERATGGRAARTSSPGGVTQVDIDVEPGGSASIDCRNGQEWITVAILSAPNFDATSVDPGSVVVFDGSSDLGYQRDSTGVTLIALDARSKNGPVESNRRAYQWRWHLEDIDGDGATDMVMEFRLDYTELTCNAAVVAVTGRTRDGKSFEGSNQVDMLVLEQG